MELEKQRRNTGIFVPMIINKDSFVKVVSKGMILSVIFEIIQFTLAVGVTDVDDVILNSLGVTLGWIFLKVISNLKIEHAKKQKIYKLALVLGGVLGILFILLFDSNVLFNYQTKMEITNSDLVEELKVDQPDLYSRHINYKDSVIEVELRDKPTKNMVINNATNIFIRTSEVKTLLGQIVKENIKYEQCPLNEHVSICKNYNSNITYSVWSSDGVNVDDLLINKFK